MDDYDKFVADCSLIDVLYKAFEFCCRPNCADICFFCLPYTVYTVNKSCITRSAGRKP